MAVAGGTRGAQNRTGVYFNRGPDLIITILRQAVADDLELQKTKSQIERERALLEEGAA